MALFTKAELIARLGGRLTTVTDDEYAEAIFYADNDIKMHTRMRYENPDDSTSEIFKHFGLNIAAWYVYDKHFNEQDTMDARKMWGIYENTIERLQKMAEGKLTSDAASVEDSRKDVVMGVVLNADDEAVSKFGDTVTDNW